MFNRNSEASTGKLIQLCFWYFIFYVITGVAVKYFQDIKGLSGMEYLVYSTLGSNGICIAVVLLLRWFKLKSNKMISFAGISFPSEFLYIIPSGVMTAIVIPTTTLMYTLPISVMVAMVIMRGSIIVISRIIDELQIRQGILKKKVYIEENLGVVFAVLAVSVHLFFAGNSKGNFDFLRNTAAMTILISYLVAYSIRIYIMNFYKNTRPKGLKDENKAFFGIEQITASLTMILVVAGLLQFSSLLNWNNTQIAIISDSLSNPKPVWMLASISGIAFGCVAFFSVFIFMFKGRTATFAGLVNRLTSLVAGTGATLISYLVFAGKFPKIQDWVSLAFILIAVIFISKAEKKRMVELSKETIIGLTSTSLEQKEGSGSIEVFTADPKALPCCKK